MLNKLRDKSISGIIGEENKTITENNISTSILQLIDSIYPSNTTNKKQIIGTDKYYWSIIIPILVCSFFVVTIITLVFYGLKPLALICLMAFIVCIYFFSKKVFLNFWNHKTIKQRAKKYYADVSLFPDRIRVLMEGDSWFNYPMKQDVTDHLSKYFNVYSLAESGDEIRGILRDGNFKKVVELENPQIVLFNAGGNELCEIYFHKIIKSKYDGDNFFTPYFLKVLDDLMHYYEEAIEELVNESINIIINGYDYVIHKQGPMYKLLKKRGFPNPDAVKMKLIDEYNLRLADLAAKYKNVYYLDLRNTVIHKDEWFDELHPNENGFLRVSRKYTSKINEIIERHAHNIKD